MRGYAERCMCGAEDCEYCYPELRAERQQAEREYREEERAEALRQGDYDMDVCD